jgi:hypothetical protein
MRSSVLAALALLLPSFATAKTYLCFGEAKGAAGTAIVRLEITDGKATRGYLSWGPQGDSPLTDFRMTRVYTDLDKGEVGPVEHVEVTVAAPANPKVESAAMGFSTDKVKPVYLAWPQYSQQIRAWKADPKNAKLSPNAPWDAFVGRQSFLRSDEPARPLLDSLETARSVIVSADGLDGTVLQRGKFMLTDRAGAEALHQQARAKAQEAARTPETACKTKP